MSDEIGESRSDRVRRLYGVEKTLREVLADDRAWQCAVNDVRERLQDALQHGETRHLSDSARLDVLEATLSSIEGQLDRLQATADTIFDVLTGKV